MALTSALFITDPARSVLGSSQHKTQCYTPYGHRKAENGPVSLLGFNGEPQDPATGHYLLGNGYRAFNPVLMRFHSPDNLSPFERGGLNAYAYCSGDPVNRMDPNGHTWGWVKSIMRTAGMMKKPVNPETLKFQRSATQRGIEIERLRDELEATKSKVKEARLELKYTKDQLNKALSNNRRIALGYEGELAQANYDLEKSNIIGEEWQKKYYKHLKASAANQRPHDFAPPVPKRPKETINQAHNTYQKQLKGLEYLDLSIESNNIRTA